jgi:hypothetical protein
MNKHKEVAENAKKRNVFVRVFRFYLEGFKSMTIGKTLWIIILAKLFIMFVILKLFFFKPVLSGKSEVEKKQFVAEQLLKTDTID